MIETWQDGDSWYRKWSDGWVEQGGSASSGAFVFVTLNTAFSNTNYTVLVVSAGNPGESYAKVVYNKTTSGFYIQSVGIGAASLSANWTACGYAAE